MEMMAEKEKNDRNLAVWRVYGFMHNVFDVLLWNFTYLGGEAANAETH